MNQRNKRITSYFILFSLLIVIGVAFEILQANLQINGTAKISENEWDVHFENIVVNQDSVSIGTGDTAATIDPTNNCKVDFSVTLSLPGDFYEFTVDVKNAGTIDAMIGSFTKLLKVNNVETETVPEYLNYIVTYADEVEILENHLLAKNTSETYKVRVEFKTDIDAEDLPDAETLSISFEVVYVQADSRGIDRIPEADFATDSWDAIIAAYNAGKRTNLQAAMEAGTTREVNLDTNNDGTPDKTAHLRIANLSTPSECETTGFSQSACGFVIEFADIITAHTTNSSSTNVGGWPASSMRTYVNNNIYNALPTDLKGKIIDTTVVSGHGSTSGETNFTSTDKLYLLSRHEVWEFADGNTSGGDTAYNNTRQLDYYANLGITTRNYLGAIKQRNGSNSYWWLRTAYSDSSNYFGYVYSNGGWNYRNANGSYGVSPAFRIAG